MFMCIWAYLRHYINLRMLYSLLPFSLGFGTPNEFATVGPYDLDWPTQQYKCWISQAITFSLLASLQAVNIFWFYLICRILSRFLFVGEAKDERSDDEEEEEALEEVETPLKAEKMNGSASKPKVMVNGQPISPSPSESEMASSGTEMNERKASLRKR